MSTIRIPDSSLEYVFASVSGPGGSNLEAMPVELAVIARNEPVLEADWTAADWAPGETNVARLLIGPGSAFGALTPGSYSVWVRVDAGVETPVRRAGFLVVIPTE